MNIRETYVNMLNESPSQIESVDIKELIDKINKVRPSIIRMGKRLKEKDQKEFVKRTVDLGDDYLDNLITIAKFMEKN